MPDLSHETPYADGKIITQVTDGVGVITFNNPDKRNAMSLQMWEGFGEALTALRDDDAVRVVIMRGAGGKAFVSGADISQFEKTRHNAAASEEYGKRSAAQRAARRLPEADDCLHPGFLSRRRHAGRDARRHPDRCARQPVRYSRRQGLRQLSRGKRS